MLLTAELCLLKLFIHDFSFKLWMKISINENKYRIISYKWFVTLKHAFFYAIINYLLF